MSHYNKNGNVWSKGGQGGGAGGMQPPMMGQGIMPFQQQQVFGNMGMQQPNMPLGMGGQLNPNAMFQHMGAVAYPNPRGMNPSQFQPPMNPGNASGSKERVFTGTVTQIHDNFGFIDDEVFFPRNVCVKGSSPMVGDRVLVEATFNATMPFKWNASRVQVLQPGDNYRDRDPRDQMMENGNDRYGRRDRPKASLGGRGRDRDRSRENKDRDDDEIERKRKRDERVREREREREERKASPARRRSRSPKRRRARAAPRYMVQIPKISLDLQTTDVFEVKRRYANLYIPSDFFTSHIRWLKSFPADRPLTLNKPCTYHVLHKELDPVFENDAVLDPEDADYSYCAKVMLLSLPSIEELYQKTCPVAEDRDKRDRDSEDRDFLHPSRMINFLVGLKGKNETMAIGGAWSPSLDGPDPQKNPSVLIKTAIRTCKALTGINLSNCTQWYRFVEIYYRRGESTHKGKTIPARVETTVIYLPDVWSCVPTHPEWESLHQAYRKHLDTIIKANDEATVENLPPAQESKDENPAPEEKDEDTEEKLEPTHHSKLEPKSLTVAELRNELKARNLPSSGLKAQLVAKLVKALKSEKENDPESSKEEVKDDDVADMVVVEEEKGDDDKKTEVEPPKKLDEKDKQVLERRYTLPSSPHLIVHPCKTAKSGKFDCTIMSLSLMLDYRLEDAKEHSFEVSLFAEQFNEMLMRDFGFNIFRAINEAPEKVKEEEKDKKKKEDKKSDDKKKKDKKEDEKMEVDAETEKDAKSEDSQSKKEEEKEDNKKDDKKTDNKKDKDKEGSKKSDDSDEEETDDKHRKDKKKKDKVKLVTKDKHLLLSFVYFDQTHCGYIFDRDLEEMLYTLGLQLSRAQIKKLISKVVSRDSLHYRKLTDKPKEEESSEMNTEKQTNLKELFAGNKQLLPVFYEDGRVATTSRSSRNVESETGVVTYNGAVIDVGKLLAQLERNEAAKIDTETRLETLKAEHAKLNDKYSRSGSTVKHLNSEVKELKDKLRNVEDSLGRANAHAKLFQTTLIDIRDKIDPVLKTVSHKEESRREKDKDVKKERDDLKKEKEHEHEKDKRPDDDKSKVAKEVKKEVKHETGVKTEKEDEEMNEVKEEQN